MQTFAQYIETRDPYLHKAIVEEGVFGDALKWVGGKAKAAWDQTKEFFGDFISGLRDQFGNFKTDMRRLRELHEDHKLDQMMRDIEEAERLGNEEHKKEVRKRWFKWLVTAGVVITTALTVSAGHAHGGGMFDKPLVKQDPNNALDSLIKIQKDIQDAKDAAQGVQKIGILPIKSFQKLDGYDGLKFELENMKPQAVDGLKEKIESGGNLPKIFKHVLDANGKEGANETVKVFGELLKLSKLSQDDASQIKNLVDAKLPGSSAASKINSLISQADAIHSKSEYRKFDGMHKKFIDDAKADFLKGKKAEEEAAKEKSIRDAEQKKTSEKEHAAYKEKESKRIEKMDKIKKEILKTSPTDLIQKIHDSPKSAVKSLKQSEIDDMIIKTFKDQGDQKGLQLLNLFAMKGALTWSYGTRDVNTGYYIAGPQFVKKAIEKMGSSPKTMKELDRIYDGGLSGQYEKIGDDFYKERPELLESYRECLVLAGVNPSFEVYRR